MKLIIWLWNLWDKYNKTRHNVWFMFLDFLINHLNLIWEWENQKKFMSNIFETTINQEKIILIKPQTFMNLSWEAVFKIMNFYKIKKEDIVVIYDDISMDFEKIRFRESWSAGWQNWIKNIIDHIWENFKRIKIWIWQDKKWDLSDWVLSKFSDEEIKILQNEIFIQTYELLIKNL